MDEQLWNTHAMLLQLLMHEGRFISERTSNFLLCNSILFTGILLLMSQIGNMWGLVLKLTLCIFGIVMSAFHYIVIRYTLQAADFWRKQLIQIEKNLNINVIETRHKSRKFILYFRPNDIYGIWLPLFFGLLWVLAFCWGIADYLSKIN